MTKADNWQTRRSMTMTQYRRTLADLNMSKAAASRWLGISQRTSSRYWYGKSTIRPDHAMLLNALVDSGLAPIVPKWSKDD